MDVVASGRSRAMRCTADTMDNADLTTLAGDHAGK
jgi:hypothetical protein